jgi:hypothetical protein
MSTIDNSSLWQMMAQLDAGIEQSEKRDAEKGVVEYRANDAVEEPAYRLPLRVVQEMSGEPVGFELPKPMSPP